MQPPPLGGPRLLMQFSGRAARASAPALLKIMRPQKRAREEICLCFFGPVRLQRESRS